MLLKDFKAVKFEDIFPHMENILHCGIFIYIAEGHEEHWSPGIYSIFGIEEGQMSTFESLSQFIVLEDRPAVVASVKKSRESGIPFQLEFSVLDARGLYKRVYAENMVKLDGSGKLVEYSGVLKDITESYFYKRALEQKVLQLDKSNQNLQEFVYVASHDLQEPLRKISTFIERLKLNFESVLGQEGNMYIRRISNSAANMQTLLEDLLSFSRLSFQLKEFESTSLKKCLDSVLSDLEIKIEETRTTVATGTLPELEAYPSQMKQLFNNLVSNAIKFRKEGEAPFIRILCEEADLKKYPDLPLNKNAGYFEIVVSDNGIGFEQEFSERIFMIFQRLNGKAEYAGSGIGLAICKKIIENHHGFIFASGQPDKGAIFTILLPKKQS